MRYLYILLVLLIGGNCVAQEELSSEGTDFWVVFPKNARPGDIGASVLEQKLMILGEPKTQVRISSKSNSLSEIHSITETGSCIIPIDSNFQTLGTTEITKKAIHVTADRSVTVIVVSARMASTDSYVAIPTPSLGKTYRAIGYSVPTTDPSFASQVNVIATLDNTKVTFIATAPTLNGIAKGESKSTVLNSGDVYTIHGDRGSDITGSLIIADKPVAVITGHSCAQVPADVTFCDMLMEASQPIEAWGKQFVAPALGPNKHFLLRAVATEDETTVTLNSSTTTTINAGEYFDFPLLQLASYISATKPIAVAQFASSYDVDSVGDPFMVLLPPVEQHTSMYHVVTLPELRDTRMQQMDDASPSVGESTIRRGKADSMTVTTYVSARRHGEPDSLLSGQRVPASENWKAGTAQEAILDRDYYERSLSTSEPPGWEHYLSVVVPNSLTRSLSLDGSILTNVEYRSVAGTDLLVGVIAISKGAHTISCDVPISVFSYGFGTGADNYDSYGHNAGQLFKKINQKP